MLEVARERQFTFATVQMPLNVIDAHYRCATWLRTAGAPPELIAPVRRR